MLFKTTLKGCESPAAAGGESNLHSLATKCPFATKDGDQLNFPLRSSHLCRNLSALKQQPETFAGVITLMRFSGG